MTDATIPGPDDFLLERRSEAAFLGAAIGDALGWPHEMRARRSGGKGRAEALGYIDWVKRSGGRFQGYEEHISAGSYSDDTQLILAVARALNQDRKRWWERLAFQELPFWTTYERGGGGATKRSALSWAQGRGPWQSKPADAQRYFEAGGNGVAMRILPHAVRRAMDREFDLLAQDVMTDGVCTHGHPRALVGALVYAFSLWVALRNRGTLGFGQIVEEALGSVDIWGRLPTIKDRWPGWRDAAFPASYERVWDETVQEQVELLTRAMRAIAAGAASLDDECLEELGCFDKRVNGAGTVTAAGALYLASRHAAHPAEGLRVAALAHGADTDTLASMTCALLGAAVGGKWLERYLEPLQDKAALTQAARLLGRPPAGDGGSVDPLSRKDIAAFISRLEDAADRPVRLPVGLEAKVERWDGLESKVRTIRAVGWTAHAENGQTFFFKAFPRFTAAQSDMLAAPIQSGEVNIGVRLAVANLARSRFFYRDTLGLAISRENERLISFGRGLAISAGAPVPHEQESVLLYIEIANLGACFKRLEARNAVLLSPIENRRGRRHFRCADPDGYQLELYERDDI